MSKSNFDRITSHGCVERTWEIISMQSVGSLGIWRPLWVFPCDTIKLWLWRFMLTTVNWLMSLRCVVSRWGCNTRQNIFQHIHTKIISFYFLHVIYDVMYEPIPLQMFYIYVTRCRSNIFWELLEGTFTSTLKSKSTQQRALNTQNSKLTLKVLNFWKLTSYCSLKPLWLGMGEVWSNCISYWQVVRNPQETDLQINVKIASKFCVYICDIKRQCYLPIVIFWVEWPHPHCE